MNRNYFIKFNPKAKINYRYIFMLHGIAHYNLNTRRYDTIYYRSINDLAQILKKRNEKNAPSYSTLNRLINDQNYTDYFSLEYNHFVRLKNNFSKYSKKEDETFVIISDKEADALIDQQEKLIYTYYCYIKYYCGLAQKLNRSQDFTAKQFLSAAGLSTDNHDNLTRVSKYNQILVDKGLIKIDKYRDLYGHERNLFSIISI